MSVNTCPPSYLSIASYQSLKSSLSLIDLVKAYCMCPDASDFLNSGRLLPHIRIETTNKAMAYTIKNLTHSNIYIPEAHLDPLRSLQALVVELFNSQPTSKRSSELQIKTRLGCVGMDSYALEMERVERELTNERISLYDRCQPFWGDNSVDEEERDPYLKAFYLEVSGHTNFYRNMWVSEAKNKYCEKHPEDTDSCQTETRDLTDVFGMPSIESRDWWKIVARRVCNLYPCAHENVKKYEIYKEIVKENCPQASKPQDCKKESERLGACQEFDELADKLCQLSLDEVKRQHPDDFAMQSLFEHRCASSSKTEL